MSGLFFVLLFNASSKNKLQQCKLTLGPLVNTPGTGCNCLLKGSFYSAIHSVQRNDVHLVNSHFFVLTRETFSVFALGDPVLSKRELI